MTVYAYIVECLSPSLAEQRASVPSGCALVFFDQQGQFNVPFHQRSEGKLVPLKLERGDSLHVHDHCLLGPDVTELRTLASNRGIRVLDSQGRDLQLYPEDERFAAYCVECDRLRLQGVPWKPGKPPVGWKESKTGGRPKLVRDPKSRAWSEMLLALIEDHDFQGPDFKRMVQESITKCVAAAKAGYPIQPDPHYWGESAGMEDRLARRRPTYMQILGVLNGQDADIKQIYDILHKRGQYPMYVQRRLHELIRLGAVKRRKEDNRMVYSRNWDWEGDRRAFSAKALCDLIHRNPMSAGELAKELTTPRWVIIEVIAGLRRRYKVDVTFDRKHRAYYKLHSSPTLIDYDWLRSTLRFSDQVPRRAARISRVLTRVGAIVPPKTYGIVRPLKGRPSSLAEPSRPPDRQQEG